MSLQVYNTMNGRKEPFKTINKDEVRMYVCGVTVYDLCHIGHARQQIVFDTIYRYLRFRGYEVTYVRNFTDVDDKIIKRANETDSTAEEVSKKFIREFYVDMDALGVMRPTFEPKATENIQGIVDLVASLVEKGFAYQIDGDVYFAVENFKGYGKLSHRKVEDLKAGARIAVDERKHSPVDFALWKAAKPGEPAWDSPWGPGRPGWHIECSAMSTKHLGPTFDIHGGGKDLIFPHHENEIAQSEAATGQPFAKYWLHNGFVRIDQEKMSKSLGNFFTIRDILKSYPPEALRLFLLSSHYRSPIDYSDQAIQETLSGLERIYAAWETVEEADASSEADRNAEPGGMTDQNRELADKVQAVGDEFRQAMDDDFNTAKAVGHLFDLVRVVNTVASQPKKTAGRSSVLGMASSRFSDFREVLGVPLRIPEEFRAVYTAAKMKKVSYSEQQIQALIDERNEVRKNRDFARGDAIRDELAAAGIVLKDSKDGTTWEVK
jgi:cysteinyl-tRNA synthetase